MLALFVSMGIIGSALAVDIARRYIKEYKEKREHKKDESSTEDRKSERGL